MSTLIAILFWTHSAAAQDWFTPRAASKNPHCIDLSVTGGPNGLTNVSQQNRLDAAKIKTTAQLGVMAKKINDAVARVDKLVAQERQSAEQSFSQTVEEFLKGNNSSSPSATIKFISTLDSIGTVGPHSAAADANANATIANSIKRGSGLAFGLVNLITNIPDLRGQLSALSISYAVVSNTDPNSSAFVTPPIQYLSASAAGIQVTAKRCEQGREPTMMGTINTCPDQEQTISANVAPNTYLDFGHDAYPNNGNNSNRYSATVQWNIPLQGSGN